MYIMQLLTTNACYAYCGTVRTALQTTRLPLYKDLVVSPIVFVQLILSSKLYHKGFSLIRPPPSFCGPEVVTVDQSHSITGTMCIH